MENKEQFLDKLFELFLLHGAKTLTMDDIAKEFSMSKKTLYQYYANKEALLLDVLQNVANKVTTQLKSLDNTFTCPIEAMIIRNKTVNETVGPEKNAFIIQLMKYYPDVYQQHMINVHSTMANMVKANYQSGLEKGLFRKDIPQEIYTKFLMTLYFSIDTSPLFDETKHSKDSICGHILNFYFDAIVTEKGKERLKELREGLGNKL